MRLVYVCLLAVASCGLELDPAKTVIHVRFDPDRKKIPMPTDILRDAVAGRLDVPVDDVKLTGAEREFYRYLNTLDGWSSASAATVEFTAPIDVDTLTSDSVQVWRWGPVPVRVTDVAVAFDEVSLELTVDAPRTGWERGERYVVLLRGGDRGIKGREGQRVECDAAFYYLRLTQKLDVQKNLTAFPGDTRAERWDKATKLEEIRNELLPHFDWLETSGVPRADVAALWAFTITKRVELAMDKASQRMPLPNDLVVDPDTLKLDVPVAPWDSEAAVHAKSRLRELDGFGVTGGLIFGATAPMDLATIAASSVELYELGESPTKREAELRVLDDRQHVVIKPKGGPLKEQTRYAVVVRNSVLDVDGQALVPMPIGHFLAATTPVFLDDKSQIAAIPDLDARRLERVRGEVADLLDQVGRENVVAAWPFTTQSIVQHLADEVKLAEILGVPVAPRILGKKTPLEASTDFPLGLISTLTTGALAAVYYGEIDAPEFLDPRTRGWREDGGHEVEPISFTMTIPKSARPGVPLPVVIFGHGIMTESRFVLAIADGLAARGFAAISIDFPYHGKRTACSATIPIIAPNPRTGEPTKIDPCERGTTCNEYGRCVDKNGQGNHLRYWPLINYPQSSGGVFLDVDDIAASRDHFRQSVVDLGALSRSLRTADWQKAIGFPLKTDELSYVGMSLGSLIGTVFVSVAPEVKRVVLNVPGADVVPMFEHSPIFGPQVSGFLKREKIDRKSYDAEKFLAVAGWFTDRVDPLVFAPLLGQGREAVLQMALLDEIILRPYTIALHDLSGVPRWDYPAEHAFLVIPLEQPAQQDAIRDLSDFLARKR
jgi:pimeloyl-ACP methyl ester carboxylesterase